MAAPWARDVVCGHRALETTGGKTWEAAHVLADYLEEEWPSLGAGPGARLLELGSGTGWLGMTVARNVPGLGEVLLSEQAAGGAVEWLEHNVERNRAQALPLGSVRVAELDWARWDDQPPGGSAGAPDAEDATRTSKGPWDLVLGSDLIYSACGARRFLRVLCAILGDEAESPWRGMLYAHTLHRFDFLDVDFFRDLRQLGLDYRLVAWPESEGEAPPGDPLVGDGFLEELFPDQRIAVFQVLPAGAAQGRWLPPARPLRRAPAPPAASPPPAAAARRGAAGGASEGEDDGRVWIEGGMCLLLQGAAAPKPEEPCAAQLFVRLPVQGPFGSGRHPTTQLVLGYLASAAGRALLARPGTTVCDYGCGSGVLGIAALALGAARAAGVDVEPTSLAAAAENAAANGAVLPTVPRGAASEGAARPWRGDDGPCGGRPLELYLPPAEALESDLDFFCRFGNWQNVEATRGWPLLPTRGAGGRFGLVLANIVVGPLCRVAPVVASLLAGGGGEVILAGMRGDGQEAQVREAYGAQGFELEALGALDDWRLLRGRAPVAAS